jgi:anthranilate phosphoribosyltransferase
MIMEMNFDDRFEEALRSSEPREQLAAFAVELHSRGHSPDEILQIFDSFRAPLRLAERESDEDEVMDVMDRICGWCGPHAKLFPNN